MQEIYDLFSADYDFLVQIVEKLRGISGDVIVSLRTKNNAYCRIVTLTAHPFIVHPYIHIHLPYILMGDGCRFQIDEDE